MRVCRIVSSASTYSSMAWWLFCVLSTSVIVTSDAWLSWLSRRLVVFFTLRTLRSVVVYTTLSTSAISSCYPLPSSVVAMRSPLGDRINCGLSYSGNSLERVRRTRGRRIRGGEREKKEREREKKRGSPRVFRRRFGKRNRSGETTGSGATTAQRLSSLRTDWNLGSARSGRHHIGTLFSASRRLQKRAARVPSSPLRHPPRRPSTPSSLPSDRSRLSPPPFYSFVSLLA